MEFYLSLAGVMLSGVNLLFVLKIIFNDLHELRQMFIKHLEDHARTK